MLLVKTHGTCLIRRVETRDKAVPATLFAVLAQRQQDLYRDNSIPRWGLGGYTGLYGSSAYKCLYLPPGLMSLSQQHFETKQGTFGQPHFFKANFLI